MQNFNNPQYGQKEFPNIDLGEFILREKRLSDDEDFFTYYSDPEVNKYILCQIPNNIEETKRELSYWRNIFYRNDGIYFAIADKETDRLIGSIGLTGYNAYQGRIEISYDLSKHYWRRGIMKKAIAAVTEYAFSEFNEKINRVEAFTATNNIASKNLLLKNGYELEGVLRQHRYHRGVYVDVFIFSILRQDVLNLTK